MRRSATRRRSGSEGSGRRGPAAVMLLALVLAALHARQRAWSEEPPAAPPAQKPPVQKPPAQQAQPAVPARPGLRIQLAPGGIFRARGGVQVAQQGEGDGELADDVVFPSDRDTLQQLERALELIGEKRYDEAVRILGDILHGPEDYFFQPDREKPIYRSVKAEAERIIGQLPQAGRDSYDLQFGAEARRMLQQARATGDPVHLADVARRYFHTEAGYEATWLLADFHLDHGRPLSAALCLERLLGSPQATRWQPTLSTKLAVCWARAQLPEKVAEALAQLVALSPRGELHVAGEPVDVPAGNGELLAWVNKLAGEPPAADVPNQSQWTMYRGDPSRVGTSQGSSPLLNARWRVPTTDDPLVEKVIAQLEQAYLDQGMPAVSNLHPLVVGDVVLMRTAQNLLAVDFRTGKRLWVAAADDSLGALLDTGQASLPALSPQIAQGLDQRLWDDSTFGTLASDGQLVFSVEDLPLSLGFMQQRLVVGRNGLRRAQLMGAQPFNRLAAHNVRSGKLVWELGGQPGDAALDMAGAFFLGPPLPLGGRLYCLAEINSEIRLLTIEAQTGKLEWSQQLAMLERSIMQDVGRRLAGLSPSYADGVLVCPTGAGAVVAVDLTTRSLLWGYRYPSTQGIPIGQRFAIAQQPMRGLGQGRQGAVAWSDSSVTISAGRVVLTPVESQELHCLDLLSGEVVWSQKREDGLYVAALDEGHVIVVGSNQVRALNLADGKPAWSGGPLTLPEGALPSGRGFASGHRYYLPLTSAEVATLDLTAGKLIARSRSRDGRVPGNLISYRGAVIAQGPDFVESYYQLDRLEREVNEKLAARADDPEALALRGEILLHSGQLDAAVDALRKAHDVVADDPRIKDLLIESLLEGLRTDFSKYESNLPQLEALVDTGTRRGEYLRSMAAGLLGAGRHAEAFQTCLKLADPALGRAEMERVDPLLSVRRDQWVNTQLAILWAHADVGLRAEMSKQLAERLDGAVAAGQVESLRQYLRFFGSLPSADKARLALAERLRSTGPALEREVLLAPLVSSDDPQAAAAGCALMAELVLAGPQPAQAAPLAARLQGEFAEVVCVDGQSGRQFVEMLVADDETRAALARPAAWPAGLVKVAKEDRPNPVYRWPSFDIRGRRGPYFADTTVDFDAGKQSLVARDGQGREVWRLPLAEQQNNNLPFNALTNVAMVSGHVMMISVGTELFAIDTLGSRPAAGGEAPSPGRLLWRQSLTDSLSGMPGQIFFNGRQFRPAWGMGRIAGAEMYGQVTGALGMLTADRAVFIKNRTLVAADLLTGETIWSRRNVMPGSAVWGDRDVLVVVPADAPEPPQAAVYRTCDGHLLGTVPIAPAEQRLGTIGRWLLTWTNENSRTVVELRDPWPDATLWRQEYGPDAKAALLEDDELAIYEPGGRFVLISLPDGRLLADHLLVPEQNVTDIAVFRSSEQYVVFVNRPWQRASDGLHVQPVPLGLNQSPLNPLANGRVYGFDRASRKLLWSRAIMSQGVYLLQPAETPLMVFAANVRRQPRDNNPNAQLEECNMLFVDKRNGRIVHQEKLPQNALYEMVGDPSGKKVVVNLTQPQQGAQLTFTFTDEPLPPEDEGAGEKKDNEQKNDEQPAAEKTGEKPPAEVP